MDRRRKVKILSPKDKNLSEQQKEFLKAVKKRLPRKDFQIAVEQPSSADLEDRYKAICDCDGIIILAFSQWEARRLGANSEKSAIFPTEFTHIGMAQAVLSGRPVLVLREKSLADRGALRGYVYPVVNLPNSLDADWLYSDEFKREFDAWLREVKSRSHVFLGYSSQADDVGNLISKFLIEDEELKLKVYDWNNFPDTNSIWESIEHAEKLTNCGIFLFMADDEVMKGRDRQFAPRDNVVLEAGYFAGAKGRSQVLIIHERGSKIPTDLGGILYLPLDDRTGESVNKIKKKLREHVIRMLGGT
jgi:hypothetical protein